MAKELRMYGIPGSGKTSRLATVEIPKAVEKFGPDKVVITSFTRTGAKEIATKPSRETGETIPVEDQHVGTLHALCYREFNQPALMEVNSKDWNEKHPDWTITGSSESKMDESVSEDDGEDGNGLLNEMNILRSKCIPRSRWNPPVLDFAHKWDEAKKEFGYVDFTDLIKMAISELPYAPGRPDVIFVDEAQDFTQLQLNLVRAWAAEAQWLMLTGDDDQCQRGHTRVLTTQGYKAIKHLNPNSDELAVYDQRGSAVYLGNRNGGKKFKITSRHFFGDVTNIQCGGRATNGTPNHKWLVKWTAEAKKPEQTAIYLMQKGPYFRVGWCQLFRSDGTFHVGVRARLEGADRAWIIDIVDNKKEASFLESYIAAEYELPMAPFVCHGDLNGQGYYSQEFLDKFFSTFDSKKQHERAVQLLVDNRRRYSFPIWSQKEVMQRRCGCTIQTIETCNLFDGLMALPIHCGGSRVEWCPIQGLSWTKISEPVYSLDVDRYHTYIADGMVTHNCIFSFAGASHEAFLNPPIDQKFKRFLTESHRVPANIAERAVKIIHKVRVREPKDFIPKSGGGIVEEVDENFKHPEDLIDMAIDAASDGKSVMILASCAFMLNTVKAMLRGRGVPFHNPYRKTRGDWNPLGFGEKIVTARDLLDNFLSRGEDRPYWTVRQFVKWAENLKVQAGGLRRKQGKAYIKALKKAVEENQEGIESTRLVLEDILTPQAVEPALGRDTGWLYDNLKTVRKAPIGFPLKVFNEGGIEALRQPPKIIIGTVHCSPPGEMVLTTDGPICIENLDPRVHGLASYHRGTNTLLWGHTNRQLGYGFRKAHREYNGRLLTIETHKSSTRVTPGHRLLVRFSENFFNKWVVYLMRRGNWYRLGACTSGHRPYKSGGITGRLATEQADCAWILKVCETKEQAVVEEALLQGKYGITGVTFQSAADRLIGDGHLASIHNAIVPETQRRTRKLLKDFGLREDTPLWTRQNGKVKKRNMRGSFETIAANFLSGYMCVPVPGKSFMCKGHASNRKPEFAIGGMFEEKYSGCVYSLEVNPHSYYVSGGAVVHNSVKGGEADVTILFPDISAKAHQEIIEIGAAKKEELYRLFYVGMTRAKERLILPSFAKQRGRAHFVEL